VSATRSTMPTPGPPCRCTTASGAGASERDLKIMKVSGMRRPSGLAWSSGTETVPQATVRPSISKGARGRGHGAAWTG
jgi:hypothetical protein